MAVCLCVLGRFSRHKHALGLECFRSLEFASFGWYYKERVRYTRNIKQAVHGAEAYEAFWLMASSDAFAICSIDGFSGVELVFSVSMISLALLSTERVACYLMFWNSFHVLPYSFEGCGDLS